MDEKTKHSQAHDKHKKEPERTKEKQSISSKDFDLKSKTEFTRKTSNLWFLSFLRLSGTRFTCKKIIVLMYPLKFTGKLMDIETRIHVMQK